MKRMNESHKYCHQQTCARTVCRSWKVCGIKTHLMFLVTRGTFNVWLLFGSNGQVFFSWTEQTAVGTQYYYSESMIGHFGHEL